MENDVTLSKEAIIHLIKNTISNYPDIEKLLSEGKLKYKSGWHEVSDKATFDAISPYVTSLNISKSGKAQVKLSKPTKKICGFAARP